MHETRYDWLADRWVIFAPNREDRPNEYRAESDLCSKAIPGPPATVCPFCYGSENETPSPTLVLPQSNWEDSRPIDRSLYKKEIILHEAHWRVRVVPNKFPAIVRNELEELNSLQYSSSPINSVSQASTAQRADSIATRRNFGSPLGRSAALHHPVDCSDSARHLFQSDLPSGCHEVIIESPHHVDSITELSCEQIELVLLAYKLRLLHWRAQSELQCAVIFKNYGADAGASLSHSHSQLIGLDFIPSDIQRVHRRLIEHVNLHDQCYICQVSGEEDKLDERVVLRSEYFIAICPYASRFPYAFSIVPRQHRPHFEELTQAELRDLAQVLKVTLTALERAQPSAAYNYVLQTAPFHSFHERAHHWRLRVIPRLSKVAGFEWGSDCYINTVKPEFAAQALRNQISN